MANLSIRIWYIVKRLNFFMKNHCNWYLFAYFCRVIGLKWNYCVMLSRLFKRRALKLFIPYCC